MLNVLFMPHVMCACYIWPWGSTLALVGTAAIVNVVDVMVRRHGVLVGRHDGGPLWRRTFNVELGGAAVGGVDVDRPALAARALENAVADPHLAVRLHLSTHLSLPEHGAESVAFSRLIRDVWHRHYNILLVTKTIEHYL